MNLKELNKKIKQIDNSLNASLKEGCVLLTGEVDDYQLSYNAGCLAVDKKRYVGVLNDIKVRGQECKMVIPSIEDKELDGLKVDVLVIGAGITGSSCARELTKTNLSVLLVDKGSDIGQGQSSRNGGVVHVGLNFKGSSLKLKYCVRGNTLYDQLSKDLSVPFERKGQVTYARTPFEMLLLRFAKMGGKKKGIGDLHMMKRDDLLKYEPSVPAWAIGGLLMGTGGITCPHRMTIATAENAAENGAKVSLNTVVLSMEIKDDRIISVKTNRGTIYPKAVINAAGVFSDVVADMANDRTFTIHPRTGTDIIMDKKVGWMINSSMGKTPFTLTPEQVAALPKKPFAFIKATIKNMHSHSKGIGFIHSVDGNMLIGPNADEVYDREDLTTTREVVDNIIAVQKAANPEVNKKDVIAYFTGIRSPIYEEDFVVRQGIKTKNVFECGGIQSPGLTAGPAIAEDIREMVKEYLIGTGVEVKDNPTFNPVRNAKPVLKELSLEERNALIKENPDYGEIVCRCEEISRGEIIDALRSPIPVYTVDAVKKRVRPGMGRCQGSFCLPSVMKIIAEEAKIDIKDVVRTTPESVYIYKETK